MGSGGPGLGRNPSKGENLRGLQEKPRQSQSLLSLGKNTGSRSTNCRFSSPLQMYRDWGSAVGRRQASPKENLGQSIPKVVCARETHPSHMPALSLGT